MCRRSTCEQSNIAQTVIIACFLGLIRHPREGEDPEKEPEALATSCCLSLNDD